VTIGAFLLKMWHLTILAVKSFSENSNEFIL